MRLNMTMQWGSMIKSPKVERGYVLTNFSLAKTDKTTEISVSI